MRILFAFIKRGIKIWLSYKWNSLFNLFSWLFRIIFPFFLAQIINSSIKLPTDYFSYTLVGIIMESYFMLSLYAFLNGIRKEQIEGTLENILVTPAPICLIAFGEGIWQYFLETLYVLLAIIIGILLGATFLLSPLRIILLFIIINLLFFSMAGIGLIAGGIILVFKQGQPVTFLVSYLSWLICGVWYPIEILPASLQLLSKTIPLTYAVNAARNVILLQQSQFQPLLYDIFILFLFCIITIPLGIVIFKYCYTKATKDGSLALY